VPVRRESRVVRCFTVEVGREETGRSVARSLLVHAELATAPYEATETM
jgi:transposase